MFAVWWSRFGFIAQPLVIALTVCFDKKHASRLQTHLLNSSSPQVEKLICNFKQQSRRSLPVIMFW